jgi:tRNA pseudouridine55 synthase
MTDEDYLNGQILLIDKPLNWTSFQAVNKLKYALINKLGLPKNLKLVMQEFPEATGLLLVCTGKFTKITELQGQRIHWNFSLELQLLPMI